MSVVNTQFAKTALFPNEGDVVFRPVMHR